MIDVEVTSEPIVVRRITGKNGAVELREQTIYVDTGHTYPTRMRVTLGRDQAPFAPGRYLFGPGSVVVGKYGEPVVARQIVLIPAGKPK